MVLDSRARCSSLLSSRSDYDALLTERVCVSEDFLSTKNLKNFQYFPLSLYKKIYIRILIFYIKNIILMLLFYAKQDDMICASIIKYHIYQRISILDRCEYDFHYPYYFPRNIVHMDVTRL